MQRNIPPQYIQTIPQGDEISLGEIFSAIWDGKWLIFLIVLLSTAIGLAYIALAPNKFALSLELPPLTEKDFLAYKSLNNLKSANANANAKIDGNPDDTFFYITKDYLLELQIEQLRTSDALLNAIKNHQLIDQRNFEDTQKYERALYAKVRDFKFITPSEKGGRNKSSSEFWSISYEGVNEEAVLGVIDDVLRETSSSVRSYLIDAFNRKVDLAHKDHEIALKDLDFKIRNAKAEYEDKVFQRLQYLKEQSNLARSLGIKDDQLGIKPTTSATSIIANINSDIPFYMRGYLAIDQEIIQINSRQNPESFIPELIGLNSELRKLKNDETIERARAVFAASPINSESFKTSAVALRDVDIIYQKKPTLILALSVILGGMIGIFAVFIRNAIRSSAKQKA